MNFVSFLQVFLTYLVQRQETEQDRSRECDSETAVMNAETIYQDRNLKPF